MPWPAKVAGYRAEEQKFQPGVGGDPETDIERIRAVSAELQRGDVLVADANTGWLMHQAARVVCTVRDIDVYIEQPCETFEECYSIRKLTDHPFVLDENIDGLPIHPRNSMQAMDVVNMKISKFGGLTKARQARDLCVSLGIAMTIEDSWGGHHHCGHFPPCPQHADTNAVFVNRFFNSYVTVSTRRRPATSGRKTSRVHRPRPRHHAKNGRSRRCGVRDRITDINPSAGR